MESLILAAQYQALNTKYYNASIFLHGCDSSCCICGSDIETVADIVLGCPALVSTLYKKCHDEVRRHLHLVFLLSTWFSSW